MNLQAALWAAQELAARRAFGAALEAERRRKRNPRLERYRNLNAIYAHTLEREERENSES
jgi:hypothetical protein